MYFLRRLRKFSMSTTQILHNFYRCTVERVLTCYAVWFGNSTAHDKMAQQSLMKLAQKITRTDLPALQDIYNKMICNWVENIINDPTHPTQTFFTLMKSGQSYRSSAARTSGLRNSLFSKAIRQINNTLPLALGPSE